MRIPKSFPWGFILFTFLTTASVSAHPVPMHLPVGTMDSSAVADAWKSATEANTIEEYTKFLASYPEAVQCREARERLDELEYARASYDDRYFRYEEYLKKHPRGKHAADVRSMMSTYRRFTFSKDVLVSERELISRYGWNEDPDMTFYGGGIRIDDHGNEIYDGETVWGNLHFNGKITFMPNRLKIAKGTVLMTKRQSR